MSQFNPNYQQLWRYLVSDNCLQNFILKLLKKLENSKNLPPLIGTLIKMILRPDFYFYTIYIRE